jgi:sugar lactone lactonase YvrE
VLGRVEQPWGLELTGLGRPFGLGFDRQQRMHVTDMDLNLVLRFDARLTSFEWHDGSVGGWQGPAPLRSASQPPAPARSATTLQGPHSVEFGADGSLYITCYYGAAIHVLSPAGEPAAVLGKGLLSGPATAFFDGEGRLLVAEYAQNCVLALAAGGGFAGRLGRDASGRLLRFEIGGGALPASRLAGAFDRPHMVRALADGTLAVADTWNNRIQRFTAAGDLAGAGEIEAACPVAIDAAPDGGMVVTAWGEDCVLSFDAHGTQTGRLLGPSLKRPYDARYAPGGIAVADSHHSRVLILQASCQ